MNSNNNNDNFELNFDHESILKKRKKFDIDITKEELMQYIDCTHELITYVMNYIIHQRNIYNKNKIKKCYSLMAALENCLRYRITIEPTVKCLKQAYTDDLEMSEWVLADYPFELAISNESNLEMQSIINKYIKE